MSEPLLTLRNRHNPTCGDPPIVDDVTGDQYIGYFENSYGEQWIFTLNRESGRAVLRGGDVGWNNKYEVIDGRVDELVLNNEELLWLQACWFVARKRGIGT